MPYPTICLLAFGKGMQRLEGDRLELLQHFKWGLFFFPNDETLGFLLFYLFILTIYPPPFM